MENMMTKIAMMENLSEKECVYLPASIDCCARKMGMFNHSFARHMLASAELRQYVCTVIRGLAAQA